MWNEDWYSQAFSGWEEGGGGEHRSRTEGIKSLQHMWAVYPLTEAHVLLTRAATGLIWGWVSPLNGAEKQLCSLTVCAAPIPRLKITESRRRIGGAALPVPPFFFFFFPSSHEPFFLVVRALMFISPGMSSPALSHRFHTFLLANLTVLLPAAESGARSQRSSETVLLLLLLLPLSSGLGVPGGIGGGEGGSHLSHNK